MGSENGEVTERLLKELDVPLPAVPDMKKASKAHHGAPAVAAISRTYDGILDGGAGPEEREVEEKLDKTNAAQSVSKQAAEKGEVGWTRKI